MNISISRDGAEIGEWTEDEVRSLYKEGQLLPTDLYWKEGMAEWKELGTFVKPPPPVANHSAINQKVTEYRNSKPIFEKGKLNLTTQHLLVIIITILLLFVCYTIGESIAYITH